MISEPMVRMVQIVHLSCVEMNTISKMFQNEFPLDPRHVEVPSYVPKMISKPMACSAQIVHLSYAETKTISIRAETSFYLTYIT
jgi:hypothetical protein